MYYAVLALALLSTADAQMICGDGVCDYGEATSCPSDCTTGTLLGGEVCGDGVCGAGEYIQCPSDCGTCGDGACDDNEDSYSCPSDCVPTEPPTTATPLPPPVVLQLVLDTPLPETDDEMEDFKADMEDQLCAVLGLSDCDRITVTSVYEGSLVVEFEIAHTDDEDEPTPSEAAQELATQVADEDSPLYDQPILAAVDSSKGVATIQEDGSTEAVLAEPVDEEEAPPKKIEMGSSNQEVAPASKSNAGAIAGGVIACVAGVAVVGGFMYKKKGSAMMRLDADSARNMALNRRQSDNHSKIAGSSGSEGKVVVSDRTSMDLV